MTAGSGHASGRALLPRHAVALLGAALTTVSAVVFLVVFLGDLFGLHQNPYLGILLFLVLPALFVLGLVLIPVGGALERRRQRRGQAPSAWPRLDLNDSVQRQRMGVIIALTAANIVIVSLAVYGGVEYMETPSFCGEVCHTAMEPEFVAHRNAPHASVPCAACHVGPGASALAESKLAGVRRVWAVAFDSYPRPIPPLADALPARATCERCHWPEAWHGDRLKQMREYSDDEQSTEYVTTLRLHVGGGRASRGSGIHWHMNVANVVEFVATDPARQFIPYVRVTDPDGNVREYFSPGVTRERLCDAPLRRMDCTDCHNRPSHPIAASAARATDASIAGGELTRSLPYLRREAVRALETTYGGRDEAMDGIARALGDFYKGHLADGYVGRQDEVARAIQAVQAIHRRNVFPAMQVTFGTYASHIGHVDSPGCFRCHTGEHATSDGRTISQDCESCHTI